MGYLLKVGFTGQLVLELVFGAIVLLWARWSQLDLGLRAPVIRPVLGWCLVFVVWVVTETIIVSLGPLETDAEWLKSLNQLSVAEDLVLVVVAGPILEELLFRGALFSALARRWGPWVAVIVPSIAWASLHTQYDPWFIASIAGTGVVLAIIRWKSGSLVLPICLHVGANSIDWLLSLSL